jgi:hypothetical protein
MTAAATGSGAMAARAFPDQDLSRRRTSALAPREIKDKVTL